MLPGRNIAAINAALHPSELIQKLLIDPFRIAASRRRRGWHAPIGTVQIGTVQIGTVQIG